MKLRERVCACEFLVQIPLQNGVLETCAIAHGN